MHLAIVHRQDEKSSSLAEGRLSHAFKQRDIFIADMSVQALSPGGDIVDEGDPGDQPRCSTLISSTPVGCLRASPVSSYQFKA